MAQVFLSYSREDEAVAKRIAEALEASGLTVWWDRSIPPGKTFDQVIEEALDASSWAIVLWSETSVGSNWVKAEAEEALRRGTLVPVLIENVRPPMAFRRIEAAELQYWDGDPSNPEFASLLKVMGKDAPPPPKASKRPAKPEPKTSPPAQPLPPAAQPLPPTARAPRMATGTKIALGCGGAVLLVVATIAVMNMGQGGTTQPAQEQLPISPLRAVSPNASVGLDEVIETPPAKAESLIKTPPSKGPAVRQQQLEARPLAPPPASTGTITLRYTGDAYNCELDLQITVAGQTIVPQSNIVRMSNIPLGPANYSVSGVIGCPGVGVCNAAGSGRLQATNGGLYDLIWQNTTYAHCAVTLVQAG